MKLSGTVACALAFVSTSAQVPPQAAATPSTCAYECTVDADCVGCGSAGSGKCSIPPSGGYPNITASCVDAPPAAPEDPPPSANASQWPYSSYTANMRLVTYNDFSTKLDTADGIIYYDREGKRVRNEWVHYFNGKPCKQWWLKDEGAGSSHFFVKTGPICIKFATTDTVTGSKLVGVQRSDWMARCFAAGFGVYMGREQVDGEWADHYSCQLNFPAKANESLVFQNWHALGLGKAAKGTPLRVTGGDSHPDKKSQTPRMQTNFYTNMTQWPVDPALFEHPKFCLPVGPQAEELRSFFGVEEGASLTAAQMQRPDFQHRAAYLPFAAATQQDTTRALTPKPRAHMQGRTVRGAMEKLNAQLLAEEGLQTRECDHWSLAELQRSQMELMAARAPSLQAIYKKNDDRRSLPYTTLQALGQAHAEQQGASEALEFSEFSDETMQFVHDGLCQEAVMMYVHHLSASARAEIKSGSFVLPLLPERELHAPPAVGTVAKHPFAQKLHADYVNQASCSICHVEG